MVADRAIKVSQPLIDSRRQALHPDIRPDLFVKGDLIGLKQVLTNLLNNAAEYTDVGGAIFLSVEPEGDEAVIRVRDDGAALSEQMPPRVFDLFAQADTTLSRAKWGLGVGLTLVRQLIQLHTGSVQAESPGLGGNSTLNVRLPLLPSAKRAQAAKMAAPTPTMSRRKLVMDDNADGANALAAVLELDGHEFIVTDDGPGALALAEASRPDILLLDIGLPKMDGCQVVRRFRGKSSTATASIFAMTGYSQPEDAAAALSAGFDLHLVKAVNPGTLAQLVPNAPRKPRP